MYEDKIIKVLNIPILLHDYGRGRFNVYNSFILYMYILRIIMTNMSGKERGYTNPKTFKKA